MKGELIPRHSGVPPALIKKYVAGKPESYLTGQVKKIIIFSVLFFGFFCGIFNYAQAETKDFYIPLGQEKSTLGDVIKSNLFNKALAETKVFDSSQFGRYRDYPGWGASDYYFGYFGPTDSVYSCSISDKADLSFNLDDCRPVAGKEKSYLIIFYLSL